METAPVTINYGSKSITTGMSGDRITLCTSGKRLENNIQIQVAELGAEVKVYEGNASIEAIEEV